jgi:2-keto-3-deoxy-L-rhamnonate aldolase RhmA
MSAVNEARGAFRQRLRARAPVFLAWTSIGHPQISEIFARSGVDCIGIDLEHSTISQEQSRGIIAAAHAAGVLCLPRIASHNMEMTKRLLDSGADGLIVPMVSTPEEVEQLIAWLKYPPLGKRSYGIARAQGYGFDFAAYTQSWNDASSLIIQIETVAGVENIDRLLSYPEVDGAMIGPYDLSGSLGIPGQIDSEPVRAASQRVADACRKHGKACGTQIIDVDAAAIQAALAKGFTFIVLASDVFLLWKWAERTKGGIEDALRDRR